MVAEAESLVTGRATPIQRPAEFVRHRLFWQLGP